MKLENQVCTLEQAKRLFTLLGLNESLLNYVSENDKSYEIVVCNGYSWSDFPAYSGYKYKYPAFTVAELGLVLPFGEYDTAQWDYGWRIYTDGGDGAMGDVYFNTEAEARAAMLIFLLENNIISPDEVNKRLNN